MKAISERQVSPAHENRPKVFDATSTVRNIRRLVWLYLLLLIFEGAFRKWIIPQLSGPLLIVRDPVVIAIYVLALRARLFPQNIYIISLGIIALVAWATGMIALLPLYSIRTAFLVTGFGVRSDFLHLPLIFIIPSGPQFRGRQTGRPMDDHRDDSDGLAHGLAVCDAAGFLCQSRCRCW